MLNVEQVEEWLGQEVLDAQNERVGKLDEVYYAKGGSEAVFAVVKSGMLGRHTSLVPLAGASVGRDYLKLAYSAEQIEQAGSDIDAQDVLVADTARQTSAAYGVEVPEEDFESAASINRRGQATREAQERAEALEEEARRRTVEAEEARGSAHDASEQASLKDDEAERARAEAERARAEAQRGSPRDS
jgi:hypothetical protein